jgi:hypothetical protein
MRAAAFLMAGVAAFEPYEKEWAEFQAVQGTRNGDIPEAFKRNVDVAKEHNAKLSTFQLSHTGPFADITLAEYTKVLGFKGSSPGGGIPILGSHAHSDGAMVDSVDWSELGAVTPIKDQGGCGSCWAFSSTGSLEGQWQIKTGTLVSLSEQQLLDCSLMNFACQGGKMDAAFAYYEQASVATEDSYPYVPRGCCRGDDSFEIAIAKGQVTGYMKVPGEDNILDAVTNQGPISVAIDATAESFHLYQGGIITGPCGTALDHAVLIVGFGTDAGVDYWKVKNSWGVSWGEDGYVRMQRGVDICGIATDAGYPVISTAPVPPSPPPAPPPSPSPAPPGRHHYGTAPCLPDEHLADYGTSSACVSLCDTPGACDSNCPTPETGTSTPICVVENKSGGLQKPICALACVDDHGMFLDCPEGTECSNLWGMPFICVESKAEKYAVVL